MTCCLYFRTSPYDLLFIFPDKPLDWLERRLPQDWPGRLLVYGPYFQPGALSYRRSYYAGATHCSLWGR
jgi:hypothetical protein